MLSAICPRALADSLDQVVDASIDANVFPLGLLVEASGSLRCLNAR